ncbi:MAG: DUF4434 domain-containing protein [Lentisphaeria bacterium]|nr:DUF4434 domain-containing protein [Lentisphaeria bacterium]
MLKITGTFLDEISWDIPHHNWGVREWERDFRSMKDIGIDTVIMIRCGLRQYLAYPSAVLTERENCLPPFCDLPDMFLTLAEKYSMKFYFGTYDFGLPPDRRDFQWELDVNKRVVEEAWRRYGHRRAFRGWYLSSEISRKSGSVAEAYATLGNFCKQISGGLPVLISPFIQGVKANADQGIAAGSIPPEQHQKEWDEIFACIQGAVDHIAFQDGHVDIRELRGYLEINMALARKYRIDCWTNCETFDRDMPIRFLPIKWEKMWHKLRIAESVGIEKAITFEFSHFMSPNSAYLQAHGLYDRYREYIGLTSQNPTIQEDDR